MTRQGPRSFQWSWRLKAANGRVIAVAGESFTRMKDAQRAVRTVWAALGVLMQRERGEI
jgi:hypothetical protein